MAIVEHRSLRWADKITVEVDGDQLIVREKRGSLRETPPIQSDVLWPYSEHSKQPGAPPHVQFANADTDEKLIEFVRQYGPLNGKWKPSIPREVMESLTGLRRERLVVTSALRLMIGLTGEGDDSTITAGLGDLIHASLQTAPDWGIEHPKKWHGYECYLAVSTRAREDGDEFDAGRDRLENFVRGLSGKRVREYGWLALAVVLNQFPPLLFPTKQGLMEMPEWNRNGVIPALFYMVRQDCLRGNQIQMCDQRDCGNFFAVERYGQRFCSLRCSQLQRQRDYWQRRGKEAREKRTAEERSKKKGRNKRGVI
jgi:hypothetical protein